MEKSWNEALKEDKWMSLAPYINLIEDSDLKHLEQAELIDFAKPKHKALMKLFILKYLEPYLSSHDPFGYDPLGNSTWARLPGDTTKPDASSFLSEKKLDLHDRIVPEDYKTVERAKHTISDIAAEFAGKAIEHLDLSNNILKEEDMETIAKFCLQIPNLLQVDLSNNCFCGEAQKVESALKRILGIKSVRFVDISGTDMVCYRQRIFFNQLCDDELKKLIWVPRNWSLNGNEGWKEVIDASHHETVISTHMIFYLFTGSEALK